ncbi:hypothetical protein EKO04_002915 [Ascochyta lentis]|uniref:MARVEL domain-containing protein n=1 Tax=Ascochyta lentis TaxID=205686 RepID=A0A8H7J9N3_9PLEO|nr:hypothetical protein EKO04_002915 [Ascochyta lentis]
MSTVSPLLTSAIRGTQALFALIVFGLSTSLIRGHHLGSLPSTLGFSAFAGGLGFVGALTGVAAPWVVVLQGQTGVLIDAVTSGVNVAGGILMATKLKGASCSNIKFYDFDDDEAEKLQKLTWNDVVCGGVRKSKGEAGPDCYYYKLNSLDVLSSRCKMSQADSVFMFLTAIVVVGAAVIGFLRLKKGY